MFIYFLTYYSHYDTVQKFFKSSLSYKKESSKEEFFFIMGLFCDLKFDDNLHSDG